ncbi:MAG: hypothetical protein NPIRA02_10790 [Nitrospirales bacterium]|nr:MAG: hypothetical protein NPIRA02_10790 [Nitrospirales bacterium]
MVGLYDADPLEESWRPRSYAHASDPQTSHDAAKEAKAIRGEHQKLILRVMHRCTNGMTFEDIASCASLDYHQVGRRVCELRRAGLVRDSGRKRKTRTGRSAVVWEYCGVSDAQD